MEQEHGVDSAISALHDVVFDVLASMKESQYKYMPNVNTMDSQPEYKWFMRPSLLGFLLEGQTSLGLATEVFSLAVNILDRYASRRVVNGRHHQLVGAVCLWIAAKYTDNKSRVPTVKEIEYLCANTFSASIICEMELHILNSLEWEISAPTAVEFVDLIVGQLYAHKANLTYADPVIYCALSKHICECALFQRNLLRYLPSVVASTAVELACVVMDLFCGVDRQFCQVMGSDGEVFNLLAAMVSRPPQQLSIRRDAYRPYDVVALLSRFVELGRQQCQEPAPGFAVSPNLSISPGGLTSPATTASIDNSPYGMPPTPDSVFGNTQLPYPQKIVSSPPTDFSSPPLFMP